ncbi:hypothetical protein Hanom_Chr06g00477561 [Helianthus anomalus]
MPIDFFLGLNIITRERERERESSSSLSLARYIHKYQNLLMTTARSMHNFSLPSLKWGCRRLLSHTSNHAAKYTIQDVQREENKVVSDDVDATDGDVKPWNLRPRRSPMINNHRVSSSYGKGTENEDCNKKRKLWISLSKEEIEEDVYALTGSKPARRPKKRNKTVQKQVDNLFPGLYLDGISPDSYRP